MIVETQINNRYATEVPLLQFYARNEHRSASDWSGFSTACVTHMLINAGFDHVFFTKLHYPHKHRQIFVGCVNQSHQALFDKNPNLTYCDREYWDKCFEASRVWDGKSWNLESTAP